MSEEYLEQESGEETIGEDSSDALIEEYEDSWDEIVEDAIQDDIDIDDDEEFSDWLAENYGVLDEDGEEEEDDEDDEDEEEVPSEEGDEEGDEDEEEVPEGAGAKARKAARLRYKKDKKDPAKMKRRAKLAKLSKKKRKGKKVKKRKALKAGDEPEVDDIEDDEVEEGAGAKARKAARLRYKKDKKDPAKMKRRAKMAAKAKKKRKGKKVKKRKALKASAVPQTKNQMLKNIYDEVNGMLKSDLATKYGRIMASTEDEEEEEEIPSESYRTRAAVRAEDISRINVEDDIEALTKDEKGLSENFKEKATTIFEAAVHAKVVDELNSKLEEKEVENAEFQQELTEKVDGYLTYVVEEWMKENELAIERGIRSELVEDFMSGLKTLFSEHYIDIPEEKVDMVDDLFTKVEDLETSLDEEINRGVELQKELAQFKKDDVLRGATKDLADTETEKISKLAEGIEYENSEQYSEKLNVLKESYFPKSEAVTSTLTETDENIEVSEEQSPEKLDESMKHYTSAIRRYNS